MTTPRRRLIAKVVDLDPFTDRADWEATVDTLWTAHPPGGAVRRRRPGRTPLGAGVTGSAGGRRYDLWVTTGAWLGGAQNPIEHRGVPGHRCQRVEFGVQQLQDIPDGDVCQQSTLDREDLGGTIQGVAVWQARREGRKVTAAIASRSSEYVGNADQQCRWDQ